MLDVSILDAVNQRVDTQHVLIRDDGIAIYPVRVRYAWPSELDLMARLAELRLRKRWSGWHHEPLTHASGQHVSVYESSRG